MLSRYFGEKPAIEHMMGHTVAAPRELWIRLNSLWVCYFVALGAINLAVAFGLSEALWIQFKVFGNFVLTFLFVVGQMPLLAKYIETDDIEKERARKDKGSRVYLSTIGANPPTFLQERPWPGKSLSRVRFLSAPIDVVY